MQKYNISKTSFDILRTCSDLKMISDNTLNWIILFIWIFMMLEI